MPPPAPELPPVLLQGSAFLVADKPAGWETIAERGGRRCLASALRRGLGIDALAPAHRLDRDTTGANLFATTREAHRRLTRAFRRREVAKAYLALGLGLPHRQRGEIDLPLSKWGGGRRAVRVQKRGGLPARTSYHVLAQTPRMPLAGRPPTAGCLLLLLPHQGRTHQIRVHARELGVPLLGDDQYGHRPTNRALREATGLRRQALHAWRLRFPDPETEEAVEAESPLADDLAAAADLLLPGWRERLPADPWSAV